MQLPFPTLRWQSSLSKNASGVRQASGNTVHPVSVLPGGGIGAMNAYYPILKSPSLSPNASSIFAALAINTGGFARSTCVWGTSPDAPNA